MVHGQGYAYHSPLISVPSGVCVNSYFLAFSNNFSASSISFSESIPIFFVISWTFFATFSPVVSVSLKTTHIGGPFLESVQTLDHTRGLPKCPKMAVSQIGHLHEYAYQCQNAPFLFSLWNGAFWHRYAYSCKWPISVTAILRHFGDPRV